MYNTNSRRYCGGDGRGYKGVRRNENEKRETSQSFPTMSTLSPPPIKRRPAPIPPTKDPPGSRQADSRQSGVESSDIFFHDRHVFGGALSSSHQFLVRSLQNANQLILTTLQLGALGRENRARGQIRGNSDTFGLQVLTGPGTHRTVLLNRILPSYP